LINNLSLQEGRYLRLKGRYLRRQ